MLDVGDGFPCVELVSDLRLSLIVISLPLLAFWNKGRRSTESYMRTGACSISVFSYSTTRLSLPAFVGVRASWRGILGERNFMIFLVVDDLLEELVEEAVEPADVRRLAVARL